MLLAKSFLRRLLDAKTLLREEEEEEGEEEEEEEEQNCAMMRDDWLRRSTSIPTVVKNAADGGSDSPRARPPDDAR